MSKLVENLPKGWRKMIKESTGFTITYISNVVLGKRPADSENAKRIMDIAVFLAQRNKKINRNLKSKISRL